MRLVRLRVRGWHDEVSCLMSAKHSVCTARSVLFLSCFALRPARVILARHLIGLSLCSEKATRQLCFHLSRFTRVLVAVEDILLVVDVPHEESHTVRVLETPCKNKVKNGTPQIPDAFSYKYLNTYNVKFVTVTSRIT